MRIPILAVPISSCALALAITLSAAGQSQPSSNAPPQSAPAQTAPATPPSAQPSTPSGNQGSVQSQSNEENPLNLTEDQKTKLRPIIMDENQQMEALRSDTTMTQEQKIARANQIRAAASPKIKAILTPEQLQKLAELQQERARQQQNQSTPPASSQPQQNAQPPQK